MPLQGRNTRLSRTAVALAAGAAIVFGGAGIASAHTLSTSTSLYNGSEARSPHSDTCNSNYVHPRVGIKDARTDGYSVYAYYYRQSNTSNNQQRIENTNGSGTTAWSGCNSNSVSRIRGCTDRPIIFDVCSDWRE